MLVTTHILRIDCPDRAGLIHSVTGVLLGHGLNIVSNSEFVDQETRRFFMRTEFSGTVDAERLTGELIAALPDATIRLAPAGNREIVVLVTREPHCPGELLIRHAFDELGANIRALIGNHDTLAPLAGQFGIPFHLVSHEGLSRPEHEEALVEVLDRYDPEYIVLAKYMRILSPEFVARYPERIINIHHSFLPAFMGANPYRQAFERGVKMIGATAHFVTDYLDEGPIIAQGIIPVDHTHSAAEMAHAGRDVEKIVLAKALRLVFDERVFLTGCRSVIL
jgi:formyltetrahydrofolate deformylase